jgi:cob(I)alamin adenosyltransferase
MTTPTGYVHVYTGDGKGKTTAAIGLAVRAAGAGMHVFFAQFAKGTPTSELSLLRRLSRLVTVRQYGRPRFIGKSPAEADLRAARKGLAEASAALTSGNYHLVVLDEINIATSAKLLTVDDVLQLIAVKPKNVELVLTGRHADPQVIALADLVTEMREIKHYYRRGVVARKGIEL